jgi:hypothetical protein
MSNPTDFGRLLMTFGVLLLFMGAGITLLGRLTGGGWLPGDLVIRRGNVTCMVPVVTSILLSILLTIVLNVVLRLLR